MTIRKKRTINTVPRQVLTFLSTKEQAISFKLARVSSPSTLIWSLVKPICIWKLRHFFPLFVSSMLQKDRSHPWILEMSPHQNVILLIGDFRVFMKIRPENMFRPKEFIRKMNSINQTIIWTWKYILFWCIIIITILLIFKQSAEYFLIRNGHLFESRDIVS